MDDHNQAGVVEKTAGKFNGGGFSESDMSKQWTAFGFAAISRLFKGNQPCPKPAYQAVRRGRSLSRKRSRTTTHTRADAAAAGAATAIEEASVVVLTAGNDDDGVAAAARNAARQAAAEAATAATTAGSYEESSDDPSASSDVPVAFTYASATELSTSVLRAIPQNVINRDEIRKWHVNNMMLGTFPSMCASTTVATKKFVAIFKPNRDMMSNGIVAWKALAKNTTTLRFSGKRYCSRSSTT